MKRKLFTLLLAIGALTAFQANAQTQLKVRILADSSGLARMAVGVHDSFPNMKDGLYNWLSFSDNRISLKTSDAKEDSISIQKDLFKDPSNVFTVTFSEGDSAHFKITPKNGTKAVTLDYRNGSTSVFSILRPDTASQVVRKGFLAKFPSSDTWTVSDTVAGYLAYAPNKLDSFKLDTLDLTVGLVGFDKTSGELSIKYFNEFAIYGNLPYYLSGFQYGVEYDPVNHPGRLHHE